MVSLFIFQTQCSLSFMSMSVILRLGEGSRLCKAEILRRASEPALKPLKG
jgi:hypothetical protein